MGLLIFGCIASLFFVRFLVRNKIAEQKLQKKKFEQAKLDLEIAMFPTSTPLIQQAKHSSPKETADTFVGKIERLLQFGLDPMVVNEIAKNVKMEMLFEDLYDLEFYNSEEKKRFHTFRVMVKENLRKIPLKIIDEWEQTGNTSNIELKQVFNFIKNRTSLKLAEELLGNSRYMN